MVLTIDANLNRSQTVAHHTTTTRFLSNPQVLDEVLAYQRGGDTEHPLTDALGSIYATTDANGAVVHRYDFDAYGVRTDLGGTGPASDLGYTGRRLDLNGLMENWNRQRRPQFGGWLQPDRAGMIDGSNLYVYASNNPVMFTDPTGMYTAALNPTLVRAIMITGTAAMLSYALRVAAAADGVDFDYWKTNVQITIWLTDFAFWFGCVAMSAGSKEADDKAFQDALAVFDRCIALGTQTQETCRELAADAYEDTGRPRGEFYRRWLFRGTGWMFP